MGRARKFVASFLILASCQGSDCYTRDCIRGIQVTFPTGELQRGARICFAGVCEQVQAGRLSEIFISLGEGAPEEGVLEVFRLFDQLPDSSLVLTIPPSIEGCLSCPTVVVGYTFDSGLDRVGN